jgi:citronellol/citronellal dehydrogenase
MCPIDASQLLRAGLLDGVSVLIAGGPAAPGRGASSGAAVQAACAQLGARVSVPPSLSAAAALGAEEATIEEAVAGVLEQCGGVELLVLDGAGLFAQALHGASGDEEPRAALRACLEGSWNVTRAVVNRAYLARRRGGRIVYLAPAADAGEHAEPARAGLENLARTLSIEWARHAITVVAIAPGHRSSADEVAALTAYLASPAGAYFSGCRFELR